MMSSQASMESTCKYQINVFLFFFNKHFKSDNKDECTWHVVMTQDVQKEACEERGSKMIGEKWN